MGGGGAYFKPVFPTLTHFFSTPLRNQYAGQEATVRTGMEKQTRSK